MSDFALQLRRVTRRFGEVTAVAALDLHLRPGELLALVGPSGSGKSTALQLIAGLLEPDEGEIVLKGRDLRGLPPGRRDVAMVFQDGALYPHLTVAENLGFPLRARGKWGHKAVQRMAERLEIAALRDRLPAQLSGGERQRGALGRALIRHPDLFLLDEPLSSLDLPLRDRLRTLIRELVEETGVTAIYVTHDQAEAMAVGDRLAVMDQGAIVQCGAPEEIYRRPKNTFVACFFGSPPMNLLPARLAHGTAAGDWGKVDGLSGGDGEVLLGFRPEDATLTDDSPLRGALERVDFFGHERIAAVRLGERSNRLRSGNAQALPAPHSAVGVTIDPARLLLFDAATCERRP